jgi:hypothetical protein
MGCNPKKVQEGCVWWKLKRGTFFEVEGLGELAGVNWTAVPCRWFPVALLVHCWYHHAWLQSVQQLAHSNSYK